MNMNEFSQEITSVLKKYNAFIEENCDLWSMMDGFIFYKSESDTTGINIRGVCYSRDGSELIGDLIGYISHVKEVMEKEYGY